MKLYHTDQNVKDYSNKSGETKPPRYFIFCVKVFQLRGAGSACEVNAE